MKNKKILIVAPSLCVGGVSRSLLALVERIPQNKCDLTLLLFSHEVGFQSELPQWVQVIYEDNVGKKENLRRCISKLMQTGMLRSLFRPAKAFYHKYGDHFVNHGKLHETHFDIVIAYQDGLASWYVSAHPEIAARRIAFVHTDFIGAGYDTEHERATYRIFEQICFGSEASRLSFLEKLPEYKKKTSVIPNAINRERIIQLSQEETVFDDDFMGLRILTVGRLNKEKGVYKIPKVAARLKELRVPFRWYLIGNGPSKAEIEQTAALSRDVVLLGTKKNPYTYMRQCDVYVQPSDYEGYCIALAEARVLCCPCVACDFSGAREQLIDGVTGLISGFSVDDLADAIGKLINNPEMRRSMSEQLKKENSETDDEMRRWIQVICED